MNKQSFTFLILVIAIILVGWQFLWPAYGKIADLRSDLETWNQRVADVSKTVQRLSDLKQKYEDMKTDAEKISRAVPVQKDIPGLLMQAEALASQSGLILNSVQFRDPIGSVKTPADIQAESDHTRMKNLQVELDLSGSASSLRSFLAAMENNLRIMDVDQISFGENAAAQTAALSQRMGLSSFAVVLNVYYR